MAVDGESRAKERVTHLTISGSSTSDVATSIALTIARVLFSSAHLYMDGVCVYLYIYMYMYMYIYICIYTTCLQMQNMCKCK